MRNLPSLAVAAACVSLLMTAASSAQTPAATPKKAEAPRTAASLECSKEADAKGLHGKERKKFRSECRKEAKPKT